MIATLDFIAIVLPENKVATIVGLHCVTARIAEDKVTHQRIDAGNTGIAASNTVIAAIARSCFIRIIM